MYNLRKNKYYYKFFSKYNIINFRIIIGFFFFEIVTGGIYKYKMLKSVLIFFCFSS